MNNTYSKAYTEVLEILSHFSVEEYSKIPNEKIEFYKSNMDINYNFSINPNINLSEQNISVEANAILVSLFRDYFATEEQKSTLNNLLQQNQVKLEEQRREMYNPGNIFNQTNMSNVDESINGLEMLSVVQKESFFHKFINFIMNLFH